eukprot:906537-Prorocentrum_minimum.AAC.3
MDSTGRVAAVATTRPVPITTECTNQTQGAQTQGTQVSSHGGSPEVSAYCCQGSSLKRTDSSQNNWSTMSRLRPLRRAGGVTAIAGVPCSGPIR